MKKKKLTNLFSLKNKVIAIFGGKGKLGVRFEKVLSSYGAKVYLINKKIKNNNKIKYNINCDVENKKNIEEVFQKIIKIEKKVDVIIYNVYSKPTNYYKNFKDYDLETWKQVNDTNLTGAFLVSQLAIKNFLKKKIKEI